MSRRTDREKEQSLDGEVLEVKGHNRFAVRLELEGQSSVVECYLSGNMRQFNIKVITGDYVRVELTAPYTLGRVVRRLPRPEKA